jgi:tRNA threonylcarbamoyl adenosine modification protein (Sua5/YciO/YrdC/YwlC family)
MTWLVSALAALRRGDIVGLPTDTVYGIAADPWSQEAVAALFAAKRRPGVKPIPILGASVADLRSVAVIDDPTALQAASLWPGGLTLVVKRVAGAPDWIGDPERGTVGVRVPDHPAALEVLTESGPLAVTSANLSGGPPAHDETEARIALGDAVGFYVAGRCGGGQASTVVDLTSRPARVLRCGAVEWTLT